MDVIKEYIEDKLDDLKTFYKRTRGKIIRFNQRRKNGWDDSEVWSLDFTFCEWALPRVKRLKEIKHGLPWCEDAKRHYTEEEWAHVMDEMIAELQAYIDEDVAGDLAHRKPFLFFKHLPSLWD